MKQITKSLAILFSVFFLHNYLSVSQTNTINEHLVDKCATHCIFTHDGRNKLQKTLFKDDNETPLVGQKKINSPKNVFLIHYDTTGVHAPPKADLNQNGISDYVDSVAYYFDYVYEIYTKELGFRSPYPDRGSRGSDHYDVYLWDLGDSDIDSNDVYYSEGGTYGLTDYANRDVFATEPFQKMYSFIVIDNDFSEYDSTRPLKSKYFPTYKYPGIPSLKVTIAHEFFHAIQFMYGLSQPAATTVMEMTAVAMERVFFPEVPDYLNYVRLIFRNTASYPFGKDNADTGYGHSIFNQYLIEKFGVGIMKEIWENVGNGVEVYSAIDLALKQHNSSMSKAWCEFLDWAYFTGNRSIEDKYFSNAKQIPLVEPFTFREFEPPSQSASANISPLEFRFVRFVFPAGGKISDDTLDVFLGNTDLNSASQQLLVSRNYFLQVANSEIPSGSIIENTNYWKFYNYDTEFICTNSHTKAGTNTIEVEYAYPNPFRINSDKFALFPAPSGTELYQKITLVIYDTEMRQIYSKSLPITVNNSKRVVYWDQIPSEFSSGVYIFGVHNGTNVTLGKFAVIDN
jgi:hypothetical protein